METAKGEICSRCWNWHEKLFLCWDNMAQEQKLICLSCLTEWVEEELKGVVTISSLQRALGAL